MPARILDAVTSRAQRPHCGGNRAVALGLGLSFATVLATVDAVWQPNTAIIGFVVLAPLLTGLLGTSRDVAAVGALAFASSC